MLNLFVSEENKMLMCLGILPVFFLLKLIEAPPVILLLAVPKRLFCFGSLVVLDVVFRYLSLFLLYINIKIGKNRC